MTMRYYMYSSIITIDFIEYFEMCAKKISLDSVGLIEDYIMSYENALCNCSKEYNYRT